MAIDSNILPNRGTYRGIDYSYRYTTLKDNANFWVTNIETGRRSWYNANAYTTYVGGGGVLNSSWDLLGISQTELTGSPALEEHPVNIMLACCDTDGAPLWGNARAADPGYNSGYACPAIAFDPSTICIDIRAIVATQKTGGSEGWNTTEVAFKNIMEDSIYEGIMENGVNTAGNICLAAYKFNFYVGTSTARTFTNRLAVVAENAPPCPEDWNAPENWYFFASSNNSVAGGIRISNIYTYAYWNNDRGCKGARKLGTDQMIIDANGAPACTEQYTISRSLPAGWGAIPNSGFWYNRGAYGSAGDQLLCACIPGNFVLKTAAATGLFFTTVTSCAESSIIGALTIDPDIYLGVMDSDGNTTGEYVTGSACGSQPQAAWTNAVDDAAAAGYVPLDPAGRIPPKGDPNIYDEDNETHLPSGIIPEGQALYAMQQGAVTLLYQFLNDTSAALNDQLEVVQKFLTNNPIDVISGLLFFPFDPTLFQKSDILPEQDIVLGNVTATSVKGRRIRTRVVEYDAGSCTYYPPEGLNDFRSYAPYSDAQLYVPYCGTVKIDAADYIGHEISVKYIIDLAIGSCIALIYRDKLCIDTIAGNMGVQLPVTGVQLAQLAAANEEATRAAQNAKIATVAAGATLAAGAIALAAPTGGTSLAGASMIAGGATGVLSSVTGLQGAQYKLEHQQIPYKSAGTSSSACSMQQEQFCRLVIHRPIMLDSYEPVTYARTKGFSCLLNTVLGSVSGYTVVSNADLSGIPASAQEKEQLLKLLQSGVYI